MAYYLSGSPVIVPVRSNVLTENDRGPITFHRTIIDVHVSGIDGEEVYPQSRPAKPGQTIDFNIGPSLRAYAERYEGYAPISTGTHRPPKLRAEVVRHDEYMQDGQMNPTAEETVATLTDIWIGRFHEYELAMAGASAFAALPSATTRPTAHPMLLPVGAAVCVPRINNGQRESSVYQSVSIDAGKQLDLSGLPVYVTEQRRDALQFQFVNSRGLLEGVVCYCLEQQTVDGDTSVKVRTLFESGTQFSHRLAQYEPAVKNYKCNTGFVSADWLLWFVMEFCRAEQIWLLTSRGWLRGRVKVKSGAVIFNRAKAELPNVDFDFVPDVNGLVP